MNKYEKTFWIVTLILSVVAFCLLALLPIELFIGWDMPFVEFHYDKLTIFGHEVSGGEKQLGLVMLSGVLMMLPSRTIPLAIMKLMKKKKHPYYR